MAKLDSFVEGYLAEPDPLVDWLVGAEILEVDEDHFITNRGCFKIVLPSDARGGSSEQLGLYYFNPVDKGAVIDEVVVEPLSRDMYYETNIVLISKGVPLFKIWDRGYSDGYATTSVKFTWN